jgi:hypothetical protein
MRSIDGKFSTDGAKIFNTVSGEEIPQDEPLFLLRARDMLAIPLLRAYNSLAVRAGCNSLHFAGCLQLLRKFTAFAALKPERMKMPGSTMHLKLEDDQITESEANTEIIGFLRDQVQDLSAACALHLDALRGISEALGHPFKGNLQKTCMDLAAHVRDTLAAKDAEIAQLRGGKFSDRDYRALKSRVEIAERERDEARLHYGQLQQMAEANGMEVLLAKTDAGQEGIVLRNKLRQALVDSVQQLEYVERNCPCGARPESLDTHPHVDGCGIEKLLNLARGLQ